MSENLGKINIAIVTPVFNDWECLYQLASQINDIAPMLGNVSIIAVDDGSLNAPDLSKFYNIKNLIKLEIIHLHCNVGHQRAIAIGLVESVIQEIYSTVIIADSDGEDVVNDFLLLAEAHHKHPQAVIVAQRFERSEGFMFKKLYSVYKLFFKLLTGKSIDFGNFSLIPVDNLKRMLFMGELWNHLAATIVKSRIPIIRIPTVRGKRYHGQSSMNLVSLITHGLSAVSVFTDYIFVRMLIVVCIVAFISILIGVIAVGIKLITDYATPGWATMVVGVVSIVILQALTMLTLSAFMILSARSQTPMMPYMQASQFIKSRTLIKND